MAGIICTACGVEESPTWWKCCSKHVSEQGSDCVCQNCANKCQSGKEIIIHNPLIDPRVVKRLKMGDWSFGHAGSHNGNGTEDCPSQLHHHHDEFCHRPTLFEIIAAGINPNDFKPRSRA